MAAETTGDKAARMWSWVKLYAALENPFFEGLLSSKKLNRLLTCKANNCAAVMN